MKDNLFRAFHNNKMYYFNDDVFHHTDGKYIYKLDPQINESRYYRMPIDDFIIMQFTGMKDKNGNKIYEGDILMSVPFTGCYHPNKQIVDFYGMSFVFRGITKNASPHTDYTSGTITNENMKQDNTVEVIGNIYENKES